MADLAATTLLKTRPRAGRDSFPIANTEVLYANALVQLSAGWLADWDDAGAGSTFMGIFLGGDTSSSTAAVARLGGSTGAVAASPQPHGYVDTSGVILMHLNITGTPTQAVVGDLVYSADSDVTSITTNSSGRTDPIGTLIRYRSSTDVDVMLFTPTEFLAQQTA